MIRVRLMTTRAATPRTTVPPPLFQRLWRIRGWCQDSEAISFLPLDNSRISRIIQLFDSINRMTETKQKILDTAERLFGDQGYAATSLRHIIAEAGVNLAAIHYHYGSKEELLDEVVMRKAAPVNAERLALLDRYEAEAGSGPLAVEKVLEAFLAPVFLGADRSPQFVRLMGRMYGEGLMTMIVGRHFQPVVNRFIDAFRRALPDLADEELLWRIHFMIGTMAHALFGPPSPRPGVEPASLDAQHVVQRLVGFLGAGFRAPVSRAAGSEEK